MRIITSEQSSKGACALELVRRPAVGPVARLAAVGDVSASGRVAGHFTAAGATPRWEVFQELSAADIVFANLECVVENGGKERPFTVDAASIVRLSEAGFTVFNLANNHVLDRGSEGVETTLAAVEGAGSRAVGAARDLSTLLAPVRTDFGDLRIGWLGAARTLIAQPPTGPRIWELNEGELTSAIRRAHVGVDVLIISLHTGFMLVEYPAPEVRDMALRLAAAGADLILMHHPHVLQGVEVTNEGRVICYSLGNFLFDWQEGEIPVPIVEDLQRQGGIFTFELDRNGVASAVFQPTVIDDECRVVRPSGELAAEICSRVEQLSRELTEGYEAEFARQRAERNTALGLKTLLGLLRSGRFAELFRHLGRLRPGHLAMVWRWLVGVTPKEASL
jgi:hypothetical protein